MDRDYEIVVNSEMTEEQITTIKDLINSYRPNKIVEIGVAAGGTSLIVLEELEKINNSCAMYSIDKSDYYYRDTSKKTGCLIDKYRDISD